MDGTRPIPTKATVALMAAHRDAIYREGMNAYHYIMNMERTPRWIHDGQLPEAEDGDDWKAGKAVEPDPPPPELTPEVAWRYMEQATDIALAMFIKVQNRIQGFESNVDFMPDAPSKPAGMMGVP